MSNTALTIPYNLLPMRGLPFKLGLSSPILNGAANDLVSNYKVDEPLAMTGLLTAVNTVGHGILDVCIPGGGITPSTGHFVCSYPPASGKSRVVGKCGEELHPFQLAQMEEYNQNLTSYRVKLSIWKKQRDKLLNQISVGCNSDPNPDFSVEDDYSIKIASQLEEELLLHEKAKPDKPKLLRLISEDATIEFIHMSLDEFPVLTLLSSEGGIVFKSRATNHLEQLNSLWSGSSLIINRKCGSSVELNDARFSLSVFVQPGVMNSYLKNRGKDSRVNGFWSRCLVCTPQQNPSFGILPESGVVDENEWLHFEKFNSRIRELLSLNKLFFQSKDKTRKVVHFNSEAKQYFLKVKEEIEWCKLPGRRFANTQDHASRLAEQIARLAALIQFFENPDSDITVDTLMDAIRICTYYSDCFLTLFDQPPQVYFDAQELNEWMNLNLRSNINLRLVPKNHIRQFGPNSLREKNRLNHALVCLQQGGMIGLFAWGKTHYIDLFPNMQIDNGLIAYLIGNPKR